MLSFSLRKLRPLNKSVDDVLQWFLSEYTISTIWTGCITYKLKIEIGLSKAFSKGCSVPLRMSQPFGYL